MIRRLDGFILRSRASGVAQYCHLLESDPAEVEKLQDFLTINVSEFFRDAVHFKVLKEQILPPMLKNNLQLNIWSAGCSIGAEAYSVAIILDKLSPYRNHRIIATDVDKNALKQAAAGGPYRAHDIRNVPKDIVEKYFIKTGEDYKLVDRIRNKVIFRQHDQTRDPFEDNFDLIMCRNVVIYFTGETKDILYRKFRDALRMGGILFVGATEIVPRPSEIGLKGSGISFYEKV